STLGVSQGEINPGAGVFTYFPSADIAPNGDIAITYLESSSSENMSMYVTGITGGVLQPAVLAAPGVRTYTGVGGSDTSPFLAGDYSGTTVDVLPSGNYTNSFWSANEYTNSAGTWSTALASYSISPPIGVAVIGS